MIMNKNKLFILYIFLIFTNFILATKKRNHDQTTDHSQQEETAKKYKRPSRSYEAERDRMIVKLLAEKGNGIYNHHNARRVAEELTRKLFNDRNAAVRKSVNARKEKDLPLPLSKMKEFQPGFNSNQSKIERNFQRMKRKNPKLNDKEVRKMAEDLLQQEKINRYKRDHAKRQLNNKSNDKATPMTAKEVKRKRKFDQLLQTKDNGVDTPEQAEKLTNEYMDQLKRQNTINRQNSRLRKKAKTQLTFHIVNFANSNSNSD